MRNLPTSGRNQRGAAEVLVLIAILVAVIASMGWYISGLKGERDELSGKLASANETIELERAQRDAANHSAVAYQKRVDALETEREDIRTALGKALAPVPDVHLPGSVGRVLRTASRSAKPAASAAEPRQAAATIDPAGGDRAPQIAEAGAVDAPVSCKALAEWGSENDGVAKANAVQVEELQAFYERQRALLEGGR